MPVAEAEHEQDGMEGRETRSPSPDLSKYDFYTSLRYLGDSSMLDGASVANRDCFGSTGQVLEETMFQAS